MQRLYFIHIIIDHAVDDIAYISTFIIKIVCQVVKLYVKFYQQLIVLQSFNSFEYNVHIYTFPSTAAYLILRKKKTPKELEVRSPRSKLSMYM